MKTAIWFLTGITALLFFITGYCKIFIPKAKLLEHGMKGLTDLDDNQIKIVGLLEILGALGMVFPFILGIAPVISAISAFCLSLTMIVAAYINHKHGVSIIPNIVIFIICFLIVVIELMHP
ncbi:MAG TPA: DoxX family protein [Bacteroidales bacterium]|nr:DoxX family protein [Bacteroidales bacterium]